MLPSTFTFALDDVGGVCTVEGHFGDLALYVGEHVEGHWGSSDSGSLRVVRQVPLQLRLDSGHEGALASIKLSPPRLNTL